MTYSTVKLSPLGSATFWKRPAPALGDGAIEHGRQLVCGNDEALPERVVPLDQRSAAGQPPLELVQRALEIRFRVNRSDRVVERLRLFVKRERRAFEHAHPRLQRLQLPPQIVAPQDDELVAALGVRQLGDGGDERLRIGAQSGQCDLLPRSLCLPLGRAIERVDIIGIVLSNRQDELHVAFGNRIHCSLLRLWSSVRNRRDSEKGAREHGGFHDHSTIVSPRAGPTRAGRHT